MVDKPDPKLGEGEGLPPQVFWGDANQLEPVLADNLLLQQVNEQFYLTFGQVRPPAVTDSVERVVMEIRPVARLIVTEGALHRIVDLLTRSLKPKE
jgi:hypothetical protein